MVSISADTTFDSSFFIGNRERLRQLFTGTAPIVIAANGLMQRSNDEPFPFYQDRSFWYLTGISEPGLLLVMDKGKEYLIVPPREAVREKFDGAIDVDNLKRISGIQNVLTEKDGWRQLSARLKKVQHVATLGAQPRYIDFSGMYTNPARAELLQRIKELNPGLELLDLRPHLARMRMIKQSAELRVLQQAIDITLDVLKEVSRPKQLAKYAFEYEIEADISRGFRRRGAEGHAFAPIVASGERSCIMHHVSNSAPLASGDTLVLDVGAQVCHYAADITRTVILGEHPSRRQEQVHRVVQEAQDYACTLLKPGVLLKEYEKHMEAYMGEKLRELGLIKTIKHDAVRRYFPHATSHFLGLDAHDAGDYDRPLEPGVVLTVEPGIYIPEEALGVRIEDDILITVEGNKVLSSQLPRSV